MDYKELEEKVKEIMLREYSNASSLYTVSGIEVNLREEAVKALVDFFKSKLKEQKIETIEKIYSLGLTYEVQVSKMGLGEEESAYLLDDFIKDIKSLKEEDE